MPELIAHGGSLPQLAELASDQKKAFLNKKNGVAFGIFWFIFFVFMAIVFGGIFDIRGAGELFSATGIFGSILIMLASLVYLPSSKSRKVGYQAQLTASHIPEGLQGTAGRNALPPQQTQPASSYIPPAGTWRSPETDDLTRRGSVTDNTTKLLNNEDQ